MAQRFYDRRSALKIGTAVLAAALQSRAKPLRAASGKLGIDAACYPFDRTQALFDGRVTVEGAQTRFHAAAIGDMNSAVFGGAGPYDVTEVGLNPFILAYANQDFRDYALLPIFLLRQFRHKSIFIRSDLGIAAPADLKGRRVGTAGYSSTSPTWIRGILEDDYGLKPSDLQWVISSADSAAQEAGTASSLEKVIPVGVSIATGPAGMDESELLVGGQVDALFHAATPKAYLAGNPLVARLFPDFRSVEQDYYRRSGIFPIMHAVAIKRDLAEKNPWLASAVFEAFVRAKAAAYHGKDRITWAADMLPWYSQELEDTRALMGWNFYSYGIEHNRKTLETLFRYAHRQGLAGRQLTVEEVFLPESLSFKEET